MHRIVWLFIGLFTSFSLFAVEMNDLYREVLPVDDQSEQQRLTAYKTALGNIFVRVSGDPAIKKRPGVKGQLKKAASLITRYQYNLTADAILLDVEFDAKSVNRIIKRSGSAIWDTRRPLTLTWIAHEHSDQRSIINEDSESTYLIEALQNTARLRGVPILLPLMDFEDQMAIQVSDVWGGFYRHVKQSSARYQPEELAIIKLYQAEKDASLTPEIEQSSIFADETAWWLKEDDIEEGDVENEDNDISMPASSDETQQQSEQELVWFVQIALLAGDSIEQTELQAENETDVLSQAVSWVADNQAARFALTVSTEQEETLEITFADVAGFANSIIIERFLNSLTTVVNARIVEVNTAGAVYKIELLGESVSLLNSLQLDDRVEQIKPRLGETLPVEHYYRWRGAAN